jgi:glycosyltransferase involved in cell wall biosynthesis
VVMRVSLIGPFGMEPKSTMRVRALPLAKALSRRGHQVALFLPPFHTPAAGGRAWQEEGVQVHNVPVSQLPLMGHAITGWRLAQAALAWRPDVVHCFKPKAYSGIAQWLLWRRRKLGRQFRLVLDSDDWEGWGGWNELEPYPPWQKRFFAWQERWGLTHADAVTVASRALETVIWSLGVKPQQVFYVPNGAADIPERKPGGERRDPPTILLYTRFFEFGGRRVVAVLRRVREELPATRLLIVGKGLFGEEKGFLAEAEAAGLRGAVEYAGWAEGDELSAHLSAAHCALYPFDDTLINRTKCAVKLIDLLAAGVPVVAEAVGQNAEYIEHGRSGLLVPPGDEAAFAAAILQVLQDRGLQDRLATGAQKRIAAEFLWDRLVGQVERAYGTE